MDLSKESREYTILARIIVDTDYTVHADSLESALEVSKELKVSDFICIKGSPNDFSLEIEGVIVND